MFAISRSAITIFGLAVHWYGILIALGIFGAVLLAAGREERLGLAKDSTLNLALLLVPVGVICARLYYVAFSWDYFSARPSEILNLRSGGLAVYGAVLGGAFAAFLYARIKRISFGSLADLVAPGLAFGQAVGRWGNFLNGEAYGAAVLNPALQFFPLSVYIEGSGWHYAAFFYESIWCALICIFLLLAERKNYFRRRGDVFLAYLFLYALERSMVEGLRADSLYIGSFRVSQLLSLAAMLAVLLALAFRLKKGRAWLTAPFAALALLGLGLGLENPWISVSAASALLAAAAAVYSKISKESGI